MSMDLDTIIENIHGALMLYTLSPTAVQVEVHPCGYCAYHCKLQTTIEFCYVNYTFLYSSQCVGVF